ncbi:MAG: sigma 54-dependent Fis family transcriptional regulator [Labilithrix sp.]|nr:sigma 54-dependent Fis family transcriptional regulator [Labilithrix sp.]MCW5811656.1 sigma 54-dependent Fis family transcriptional regulator [Labilithrix sp.]
MSGSSLGYTVDIGDGEAAGTPVALKLVVVDGPDAGAEVPIDGPSEIGAEPGCALVLSDPAVSRRHARVAIGNGNIVVTDLESRNGTFVGEARIREAELPIGSVLRIGKSLVAVQLRWRIREVPPSNARSFGDLYGESLAMREIFAILERVARSDVTVLVEGESGTGKELVARSIHRASRRASGPYVVFDCSAVPADLAESELFGHKKGAFSGATADRPGAFRSAHGGTLCLDELGELPLDLQPKLLRALENREVRAVGEDAPRKIDVRVIASTNRDLHAEVQRGRFRADLLYRLEVVRVRMPPLRARPDDIAGLVERLLENDLPPGDRIEGENLKKLAAYAWPGNVRELKNTLARAVALGAGPDGPARFTDLVFNVGPATAAPATIGFEFPGVAEPMPFKDAKAQLVEAFERAYVAALRKRHPGNVQRAADAAGLSRKHLYELLKRVEGREPE